MFYEREGAIAWHEDQVHGAVGAKPMVHESFVRWDFALLVLRIFRDVTEVSRTVFREAPAPDRSLDRNWAFAGRFYLVPISAD